ncbi:hypothetical protein CSV77_15860 [Sporosarcina sp. P16b]|uniref:sporulation histidine kinase inhibitor Sda n=1 Tax=Sporosarcina sp. P16b TaxID=2048261 RepID=UPI000C162DA4|nr:sporulation histidine kinase inhibitor Sda [Sporosarcina sp. P16b]PIC69043.1 hypothetical protein CSV77_15860 [Sporosarcina sp. P16b]
MTNKELNFVVWIVRQQIEIEKGRANKMERISDEFLVESFIQAKKMGLDLDFISILEEEIKLRKLNIDDYQDAMNCI